MVLNKDEAKVLLPLLEKQLKDLTDWIAAGDTPQEQGQRQMVAAHMLQTLTDINEKMYKFLRRGQ